MVSFLFLAPDSYTDVPKNSFLLFFLFQTSLNVAKNQNQMTRNSAASVFGFRQDRRHCECNIAAKCLSLSGQSSLSPSSQQKSNDLLKMCNQGRQITDCSFLPQELSSESMPAPNTHQMYSNYNGYLSTLRDRQDV